LSFKGEKTLLGEEMVGVTPCAVGRLKVQQAVAAVGGDITHRIHFDFDKPTIRSNSYDLP
jgi:hypothetical protein